PLKNLLERKDLKNLPHEKGFLSKNANGEIIDGGQPDYVKDLNSLPLPDYSEFKDDILNNKYSQPHRLDVLDARGCINECHFCYEQLFWPHYRSMSAKRLFEQIQKHMADFPQINYFYFNGLLINGDLKKLEEFCDLIIENNVKISWAGQATVRDDMTPELLKKMRRAGLGWVGYGIESGSQKVLDAMNKKFTVLGAIELLKNTREAGIAFQVNMMFGFPTETEEDFQKTLKFLVHARPYINSILASQSFFTLEKGTYVRNHPEKFGITDSRHHLYWKADNGKNDYAARFDRYERFCRLALELKIPETSGISEVKPDKHFLLGEYYLYDKNYAKALEHFEISEATEYKSKEVYERIAACKKEL
ncbi:MAG: radical SAM protein, partial [Elusimicrobia bacterium]|nr:radical SAM protein [Elusimicrobiota bacterium]